MPAPDRRAERAADLVCILSDRLAAAQADVVEAHARYDAALERCASAAAKLHAARGATGEDA